MMFLSSIILLSWAMAFLRLYRQLKERLRPEKVLSWGLLLRLAVWDRAVGTL